MEVRFTFDKDTKNARRYTEVLNGRERGVVGSIYVLKTDLQSAFGSIPDAIAIVISAG